MLGQWNFAPRLSFLSFIGFRHQNPSILEFWKISILGRRLSKKVYLSLTTLRPRLLRWAIARARLVTPLQCSRRAVEFFKFYNWFQLIKISIFLLKNFVFFCLVQYYTQQSLEEYKKPAAWIFWGERLPPTY